MRYLTFTLMRLGLHPTLAGLLSFLILSAALMGVLVFTVVMAFGGTTSEPPCDPETGEKIEVAVNNQMFEGGAEE